MPIYPRASYVVMDKARHFLGVVEQVGLIQALIAGWRERLQAERHGEKGGESWLDH